MNMPSSEKIKISGLVQIAGWILCGWGMLISFTGLYHAFFGEPEANLYSYEKWQFVTEVQWLRWSGFEMAYGLACMALGFVCLEFAKKLPETVLREKQAETDFN